MHLTDVPTGGEIYRRRRAVSLLDPLVLAGHCLQGLVPRNPLELAFASLADPPKRVEKPVRSIYPLAVCTAPEAVPELGLISVIGLQACDHAVPDMYFEQAGSTTIHIGPDIVRLFHTSHITTPFSIV
jgi:hypothetical protein